MTTDTQVEYDVATLPNQETSTSALVLDTHAFDKIMAVAETMALGKSTVPKHLQGNAADCMAIIIQAMQWKMNPFVVAQKTHLVNGTLGYEAQLVNAVVSTSGAITGRFHYEYGGDWAGLSGNINEKAKERGLYVRVGAIIAGDEDITWSEPLYLFDITTRNSPLWKTNPKQQLSYLAVKNWTRLYTPDALMGVYSTDELQDSPARERDITPRKTATDYAQAAKAEVTGTDTNALISAMEQIVRADGPAEQRIENLNAKWKEIGKQGRAAVGRNEYERLFNMANAIDADAIEQPETHQEDASDDSPSAGA